MKITFLGTGTSCGVPVIGCQCEVCTSKDPRDKRLRCSILVETDTTRILVDCGPDFRQQMLTQPFRKIDAVLLTHIHYDHVAGIDDLRPYCHFGEINVYANHATAQALHQTMPYCFATHLYPGVPTISLHEIAPHQPLQVGDIEVMPLEVMHGKMPILAYRFDTLGHKIASKRAKTELARSIPSVSNLSKSNINLSQNDYCKIKERFTSETLNSQLSTSNSKPFAYITDMKTISDDDKALLAGIDTLVCNALRWDRQHHSHQLVADAVGFAQSLGARRTLLIHGSHHIGLHAQTNRRLPEGVELAYDGQTITL